MTRFDVELHMFVKTRMDVTQQNHEVPVILPQRRGMFNELHLTVHALLYCN